MRTSLMYYLPALIIYLLVSTVSHSQVQKIYVQPKATNQAKQSHFVDSIRFVPLDVRDDIKIGVYNNVRVTDKYFLISDYPGKSILLFAKNGAFVKKISYRKLGESFYPGYEESGSRIVFFGHNKNYTLTQKDLVQIRLDWNNPRNKKYFKKFVIDLNDTSFRIRKDAPDQKDILEAFNFYDDLYYQGNIVTSPLFKDSLGYEVTLYKNDQKIKGFFPYNRVNEPRFLHAIENVSFNTTDTPFVNYITRPYCDTIYKMVRDSLFPVYKLVLPMENSLPLSFFSTPFRNQTERENFTRNHGWTFHQVYSFYETSRFIYFVVGYMSNYDSYIYEKQANAFYRVRNIKPDSSQFDLQLLEENGMLKSGEKFYRILMAADLLTFFEEHKNVTVPGELEKFLKGNPQGDAPVIVEFKLKN